VSDPQTTDATPYDHLIEYVQDSVVEFELVDGEPIVRDVNAAFVETFGYAADDVRAEPLNDLIVPEWLATEADTLDRRTAAGEINRRRVKRETATGLREFLYRGIPYPDDTETALDGFAVYTDITDLTRSEHRLQVLNRVLRHNLRNESNVILGHTARLLDQLGDPSAEAVGAAAAIEKAAASLEKLTREATEIDSLLSAPEEDPGGIDCVPVVYDAVRDHRQASPGTEIAAGLPKRMVVRGDRHLGVAVRGLIDNAIEHNPAESPFVEVSVAALGPRWAAIRVADDGPRIAEHERAVVTGEAEPTRTRHGSGLGLWLVKWVAERYGGELSFEESEYGGNVVQIRLPRV
jgi:PAS domain S-box-containing protein